MKAKGTMLAVVACAALLGCASAPPDGSTRGAKNTQKICDKLSEKCAVEVSLLAVCPSLNKCLDVDYQYIVTKKEQVKITWVLATLDQVEYSFDERMGINFKEGDEHFACTTAKDGKSVDCDDKQKNKDPFVYKYTINVIKVKGSACGRSDPHGIQRIDRTGRAFHLDDVDRVLVDGGSWLLPCLSSQLTFLPSPSVLQSKCSSARPRI